jgi:hypothetical protein
MMQVHAVVEDATNLNGPLVLDSVQEKMTANSAMPGYMENTDTWQDIASRFRADRFGAIRKLTDGLNERVPVNL